MMLLAVIPDAVAALDDGAGPAANAIARCVVTPTSPRVVRAAPGATPVIGPYGIPRHASIMVVDAVVINIQAARLGVAGETDGKQHSTREGRERDNGLLPSGLHTFLHLLPRPPVKTCAFVGGGVKDFTRQSPR